MTDFNNTAMSSTYTNGNNYSTTAILNTTEIYSTLTITNMGQTTSHISITPVMTSVSEISVSITPSQAVSSSAISSTSIIPTQTQSNGTLAMIVLIIIDEKIDVTATSFIDNMETKLLDTYIAAKSVFKRRKRRAASKGNTTLEVCVRFICISCFNKKMSRFLYL